MYLYTIRIDGRRRWLVWAVDVAQAVSAALLDDLERYGADHGASLTIDVTRRPGMYRDPYACGSTAADIVERDVGQQVVR